MKTFFYIAFCLMALSTLAYIFWKQELQYSLPTEVPANLVDINSGEKLDLKNLPFATSKDKATFVHFYNNDCPCSRFNAAEFDKMVLKYKDLVNFYAVVQINDDAEEELKVFKEKYNLGIPIVADPSGKIAQQLGVYATPQAVIINTDSTLFFKGNYNRARYCVSKNTKFAEMALDAWLKDEPAPQFGSLATVAYGCELPVNQKDNTLNFLDIF